MLAAFWYLATLHYMKTFAAALVLGIFSFVPLAHAQGDIGGATVGEYLSSIIGFINAVLIPFIFAIAFIVFIWGVFQYFIAGGANEEKRDQGKQLVMWGIIGFVVMVSVWGIVNLFKNTLGFDDAQNNAPQLPRFNPPPSGTP